MNKKMCFEAIKKCRLCATGFFSFFAKKFARRQRKSEYSGHHPSRFNSPQGRRGVVRVALLVCAMAVIVAFLLVYRNYFINHRQDDIQKAHDLFVNGESEDALKVLERRYAFDKNDKDIASQLAVYYFQAKKFDDFSKVVKNSDFDDPRIYTMQAYLARSSGDSEKAIEFYKKAIDLRPRSSNGYIDLSNYFQILGQADKALETVEAGLSYSPRSSTLNLLAANYSLEMNNTEQGKIYAKKVLELDSDNVRALEIIKI